MFQEYSRKFKAFPGEICGFNLWTCDLRQYPSQLGDAVHQLYMQELSRPVVGSLRVNLTPSMEKTAVQLFDELPMGDVWKDACLLPVFQYLYFCRHTRTVFCVGWNCPNSWFAWAKLLNDQHFKTGIHWEPNWWPTYISCKDKSRFPRQLKEKLLSISFEMVGSQEIQKYTFKHTYTIIYPIDPHSNSNPCLPLLVCFHWVARRCPATAQLACAGSPTNFDQSCPSSTRTWQLVSSLTWVVFVGWLWLNSYPSFLPYLR